MPSYKEKIIEEMCNMYNDERLKTPNSRLILDTLEQFLIEANQNLDDIINFCLNDQANPTIQIVLASCYHYGKWIEKDEHKAFIYYQKSEEMGDAEGTYMVGYCYDKGIGIAKDEHKAFIYYQKSAEMGNASGTYNVGNCYQNGIGVERDEHRAFNYYQKSAEMGIADGTNCVGYYYHHGIGVDKDEHKAFIYYQKSADMGSAAGTYNVGYCYEHGIGIAKDEYMPFIYYQKSAEMGNAAGIYSVGYCYRNGIGISRDLDKAKYWFQREKDLTLVKNECVHNSEIEDELKKILIEYNYQLAWISYDEFKDVKFIGRGNYAKGFYARWFDKGQNLNREVALKFHDNLEIFIKELKAYCDIGLKDSTFLKCFGISKPEVSKIYILVLQYAPLGNLHKNLNSIAQINWKDKLNLLQCIASDLQIIHSHDLIHRDLHNRTILLNSLKSAYIVGLGSSITTNIALKSTSYGFYGNFPYTAPEVLNRQPYTKASDIYSFGIIMWEILYGKSVSFEHYKLEKAQIQVSHGLRPHIYENIASCYADLMEKCWHTKPEKRPTAADICDIFAEWQNNENILSELYESDKKSQDIGYAYFDVPIEYLKYLQYRMNPYDDVESIIHEKVKFENFKKIQLKYNIEWIPFNRLSNIETIGKGGFSTVYQAIWLDYEHSKHYNGYADDDYYHSMHESFKIVALKTITLNEFENHMKFTEKYLTLDVYGLTLEPETEEYMMVFQYAKNGSLYNYLKENFQNLNWEKKLEIILDILKNLKQIHDVGLIHSDFHSGNILQDEDDYGFNLSTYISDLGLAKKENQETGEIYGVLPYVSPEVLQGKPITRAADVYGLGIIMWELSTGQRPYDGIPFEFNLLLDICNGLRPEFPPETPKCYIDLAKQCMDTDPDKRPIVKDIHDKIKNWLDLIYKGDNETYQEFENADKHRPKFVEPKHPYHMYTSKAINTLKIKQLTEQLNNMNLNQQSKQIDPLEIPDDYY